MGKQKIDELPTLHKMHAGEAPREEDSTPIALTRCVANPAPFTPEVVEPLRLATLEVPLGLIDPTGYIPVRERLEAKCMTQPQSIGLLIVFRGMQDRGETLRDGTPVKRPAQAVRRILEEIYRLSGR